MSYFAKVEKGIVTEVIVVTREEIYTEKYGDSFLWLQTSITGEYRKTFAGIGDSYDKDIDAFIPKKPEYDSWILNEDTYHWESPIARPNETDKFVWDESNIQWVLYEE